MKIGAVARRRDEPGTDGKGAETFARLPPLGIGREQRVERGNDAGMIEIFAIKLVEPRAVEGAAQIEIVAAGAFADQADFGEIGPGAAVRASGHADDDVIGGKTMRRKPVIERVQKLGQIALALGQREAAGRQRHAGHRVAAQP